MDLKKYNNPLTSERWYTKEHNDAHILDLFRAAQNLIDDSKKTSDKSNKEPKKWELAYIRDLPPWILEEKKWGVRNKTNDGREYWWCK